MCPEAIFREVRQRLQWSLQPPGPHLTAVDRQYLIARPYWTVPCQQTVAGTQVDVLGQLEDCIEPDFRHHVKRHARELAAIARKHEQSVGLHLSLLGSVENALALVANLLVVGSQGYRSPSLQRHPAKTERPARAELPAVELVECLEVVLQTDERRALRQHARGTGQVKPLAELKEASPGKQVPLAAGATRQVVPDVRLLPE